MSYELIESTIGSTATVESLHVDKRSCTESKAVTNKIGLIHLSDTKNWWHHRGHMHCRSTNWPLLTTRQYYLCAMYISRQCAWENILCEDLSQPVSNTILHLIKQSTELLLKLRLQNHTKMLVYTKLMKLKLIVHYCLPLFLQQKKCWLFAQRLWHVCLVTPLSSSLLLFASLAVI